MKTEKIKEKILEHICEGTALDPKIQSLIESDQELKSYHDEMQDIFSRDLDDDLPIPDESYWENTWQDLEPKLTLEKSNVFRLFEAPMIRYAAVAIVFVVFGFLIGDFYQSRQQINAITQEQQNLNALFHKTRVLLTTFVTMDEYSTYEMLNPNIEISKKLLEQTLVLKDEFSDNAEIEEVLSQIHQILTMITALKDKSAASIKMTQFGIENKAMLSKLNQIEI